MSELSIADGFVEINENVGDMIKYVANEPSVGLYYIQQHVQNAVPNVIRLKNTVMEKSHELSLHTEDVEDSIAMTRSMKECGPPIIDEMIRDIKTSLTIMSTKQPIRGGVIQQRSSSYQIGGSSSWSPVTWARSAVRTQNDSDNGESYLANVFKSAKEKAGNLKWAQLEPQPLDPVNDSFAHPQETEELPVSSQVENPMTDAMGLVTDGKLQPVCASNGYEEFKADREAKLEEWLKRSGNNQRRTMGAEGEGHHQFESS